MKATNDRSKDRESLRELYPSQIRAVEIGIACLSVLFLVGQFLISFDVSTSIDFSLDIVVTKVEFHEHGVQREFSIFTAVQRLLFGSKDDRNTYPALGVLILCWSGIWPHVKLMLLALSGRKQMTHHERSRWLTLLGILGKFSFLDLFIVVFIACDVVFLELGAKGNWAAATTREGMVVFTIAALSSQVASARLGWLHRQAALGKADEKDTVALWDPRSMAELSPWLGMAVAVGALIVIGLILPSMALELYTVDRHVEKKPIFKKSTEDIYSVWTTITAMLFSPTAHVGQSFLAVLSIVLVTVVPVLHMALCAAVCVGPLSVSRERLAFAYGIVEIAADYSCLDVFLLALLPVAVEIGGLSKGLPGHLVHVTVEPALAVVLLAVAGVLGQYLVHGALCTAMEGRLATPPLGDIRAGVGCAEEEGLVSGMEGMETESAPESSSSLGVARP